MIKKIAGAIFWMSVAALVLGMLGPWLQVADSFAQFRHVLVVIVAVAAVIAGVMREWRRAGIAGVAVIAAVVLSYPHLPLLGPPVEGTGTYKLIQFNVKIHNAREAEAAQWIISEKPDVVMLQEFLDETHPGFVALDPVLPYRVHCTSAGFGEVVVRSRHPVVSQYCGAGDGLAWAQVNIGGRLVTFASLHLRWPWPFRQWEQLEKLKPVFATMPQPVVLGGDHNAVPWSAAVKTVARWTGSDVIGGYHTSFWPDVLHNGRPWGVLPIDHVLLPKGVTARRVAVGPVIGSDHVPVIVEFDLP